MEYDIFLFILYKESNWKTKRMKNYGFGILMVVLRLLFLVINKKMCFFRYLYRILYIIGIKVFYWVKINLIIEIKIVIFLLILYI